jgi:hypothetical protein
MNVFAAAAFSLWKGGGLVDAQSRWLVEAKSE